MLSQCVWFSYSIVYDCFKRNGRSGAALDGVNYLQKVSVFDLICSCSTPLSAARDCHQLDGVIIADYGGCETP